MTENKEKVKRSKPTISVSFPEGDKEKCMKNLRFLVTGLKRVPGTLVESQSGLIRALLLGGVVEKGVDGDTYIKFKVVDSSLNTSTATD